MQYMQALQKNPIRTKAMTSAVLNMISDLVAQAITIFNPNNDNKNNKSFDLIRTLKFGCFGALVTGPYFHFWYELVGNFFKGMEGEKVYLYKILADRFVATPIFFCLFYTWSALTSLPQDKWSVAVLSDIDKKLAPTVVNSLFLYVPAQYYNFKYVPLLFRVLFGNLVSLIWNVYFSIKNNK